MKTAAIYGGAIAFANAFVTLLLFFFGFHNNPDRMLMGMLLGLVAVVTITAIGLVLGIRAIRAEKGPGKFSYGQAFIAGLLVAVFCSVFGTAFQVAYIKAVNPRYTESMEQWAQGMMEKGNMPSGEIEERLEEMRAKSGIGYQVRNGLLFGLAFGTVTSLIAAAFLRRNPDSADAPAA